jgi:hypothetical protein
VIKPAAIIAMLEAPRRRRDRKPVPAITADPQSIGQLEPETLTLLRRLAVRSLEALGVRDPEKFVMAEMESKFNSLAAGIAPGTGGEKRLRAAIDIALEQLDE